jgi:hypothetical protein
MRAAAFILGNCAIIALAIGPAGAGQCTSEVDRLTKVLIAQEVGSGPSPSMWLSPSPLITGQADEAGSAAAQSTEMQQPPMTNRETTGSSSPTQGSGPKQDQASALGQEVQGLVAEAHSMAGAMNALERARFFDRQGKESECLSAVGMAKLISGFR